MYTTVLHVFYSYFRKQNKRNSEVKELNRRTQFWNNFLFFFSLLNIHTYVSIKLIYSDMAYVLI